MRIVNIAVIVLASIVMSGCGGGSNGSDKGSGLVSSKSYLVSTSDAPQHITLASNQNIIAEGSCTTTKIYGGNGASYESKTNLNSGDYTVVFTEVFNKYTGSKSALYYTGSGITLPEIPLNTKITAPSRSVVLFKLTVPPGQYYMIDQSNAWVKVFNQNLENIIYTNSWEEGIHAGDSFTLPEGVYFVLGNVWSCRSDGTFRLVEL